MAITFYQILQRMHETNNKGLRLSPLSNIISSHYHHKRGSELTIGVEDNVLFDLSADKLMGGMLLINREEGKRVERELELELLQELKSQLYKAK